MQQRRRWTVEEVSDALAWAGVALLAVWALADPARKVVTAWIQ